MCLHECYLVHDYLVRIVSRRKAQICSAARFAHARQGGKEEGRKIDPVNYNHEEEEVK